MIINDSFVNTNEYNSNNKLDTTIIITHGLAEYSKSYINAALAFEKAGFNVITYDLRGHGKTRGKRGYVKSYKDFVNDLDTLVKYAYKETNYVYLIGHSMGGVITNIYTAINNSVDGVIITASPTNFLKELNLLRFVPKFITNGIKVKTNFKDATMSSINNYQKDAYDLNYFYFKIINETMFKGMKVLRKNLDNYDTPILMIYSKSDKAVGVEQATHFLSKIPVADQKLLVYEDSYHNLFVDIEFDKLINDITEWIKERINLKAR